MGKEYIRNNMQATQCLCCKKKGTKVWMVMMIQLLYKKGLRKTEFWALKSRGRMYQNPEVFETIWNKCSPKQTSCYTLWVISVRVCVARSSITSCITKVAEVSLTATFMSKYLTSMAESHSGCSLVFQMIC